MNNTLKFSLITLILVVFTSPIYSQDGIIDSLIIYDWQLKTNEAGKPNFLIGVDSHKEEQEWILDMGDNMEMAYTGNQGWGAVFITIGEAYEDWERNKRASEDYSRFTHFSVELKGKFGGEFIELALKDKFDPNNGNETKVPVKVTDDWKTYEFPLKDFRTADLEKLHVVSIFVFRGADARTVYYKNIKFIKKKTKIMKN